MTLKNTTKIALLFFIMVLPLASSSAYADGSAEIVKVCGFTSPSDVPLGLIVYGQDGDENNFTIDVTGNGVGTLELEASDWVDVRGDAAQGLFHVSWVDNNNSIEVNGLTYYAVNAPELVDFEHFHYGGDNSYIAYQIADLINARDPDVIATASPTVDGVFVIITASEPGVQGNSITISEDVINGSFTVSGPTLTGGGENGDSILPAETTRYSVTTDGTASDGSTYLEKTALAPTGQNVVLTTEAFRDNPINLTFQLTGIDILDDVDFTGAITQDWTFTYFCTG